MKRRTIVGILAVIVVAAAAGVIFWRWQSAQGADEDAIRSAVAERGELLAAVTASGRIEPESRVGLTFEAPGRVAELLVQEGDRVVADDILARLDTEQLQLQVDQARAALTSAEAQLAQLERGPRPADIERAEANLRASIAQLSAAEANRDQAISGPTEAEIAAARARVAQARTAREVAQDAYDRIEDEGTRKEQANYDLYTAKQDLAAAEAQLEDLLTGPSEDERRAAAANVAAAEAQRDASQAQLDQLLAGSSPEEIAEVEAQVDQAQVALALAELSLRNASLRAPFAGIISENNLTPGELPPTRQPAMVLVDNSAFHITIGVDELDVSSVEEGQRVEVTLDALPDADVEGTIRSIAPAATSERGVVTYDVLIDLTATDAPLRADMTANATIVVAELTDVLKIPTWAVRVDRETGQTFVDRRVGSEIERVDVELGTRYEEAVQVLSGLSEGDEVVRLEDSTTFEFGPR